MNPQQLIDGIFKTLMLMEKQEKKGFLQALTLLLYDEEICMLCKERIARHKALVEEDQIHELKKQLGL